MDKSPASFIALGGVWLDEIRKAGSATKTNVVGGSVTFGERTKTCWREDPYLTSCASTATLGARLFTAKNPTSVRLVFLAGNDFPQDVITTFRRWKVGLTVHHLSSLPSARGVIQYDGVDESSMSPLL